MKALTTIAILLLAGCAGNPASRLQPPLLVAGGNTEVAVVLPPPRYKIIPVPPALVGRPSDFFTAPTPSGPWTYRTDDFYTTNDNGEVYGQFRNSPPEAMQEFVMIVPVDGEYPLPANIITNAL